MERISIENFISKTLTGTEIIDVRSPAEFDNGHIPRALNLPLFNDEERAKIGIIYKQLGKHQAIDLGIDIVGLKLSMFKDSIRQKFSNPELLVYCWRGGMRSASMGWLIEILGKKVYVLENGYKSFRNYIKNYLNTIQLNLLVLGGKTGTGKTTILNLLKDKGEQIIDFEKLADHKGSAFGNITSIKRVGTEEFENNLFSELIRLDLSKPIWVENESRGVGLAQIPENIWTQMRAAQVFQIEIGLENRLKNLLTDYSTDQVQKLILGFEKIRKRLGHKNTDCAIDFIQNGNLKEAAKIALLYYDKTYLYGSLLREPHKILTLEFEHRDFEIITEKIIKLKNEWER